MSVEQRLRESLRRPADGDRDAEERAWHVIAAAAPEKRGQRGRLPPARRRAATALGGVALVITLAVSPPGAAVSSWIGDGLGVGGNVRHEPASPALRALPGGGELLVGSNGAGASIVHADGSRRRLGPYRDVSWSPNGLFVAATRGRQLLAVTPTGEPRWALTPSRGAASPRWAPSGLRIAYRSGNTLRVVAGDGSGDLELMRHIGAVALAWRPNSADELAVVDGRGRIALISAVTGKRLWHSEPGVASAGLAWSSDGEQLAALTPGAVNVLDGSGARVARLVPRPAASFTALGYSPAGRGLAMIERGSAGDAIHIAHGGRPSRIFATAATLRDPLWSPDGRWLLVSSPAADQWLFLRTRRPHRVVAVSDVAAQLSPGARFPAVPRPSGWCCAR